MKYGYDFKTKNTFGFDGEKFNYLGKKDYKDIGIDKIYDGSVFFNSDSKEVECVNSNYAYILGAYYLSGATQKRAIVILSDGIDTVSFIVVDGVKCLNIIPYDLKDYNEKDFNEAIVVCGNVCNIPSQVADIAMNLNSIQYIFVQ